MRKTIYDAFTEFKQRYEPSRVDISEATAKQTYIRNILSQRINLTDDFLIGSYVKKTQIRPTTDIDIFLVLDNEHWDNSISTQPNRILGLVLNSIRRTYPSTKLKKDGQSVRVAFSGSYAVDLVPAFKNMDYYIIPNNLNKSWIPCNPKDNIRSMSKLNNDFDEKLKPLIKMIKCWNLVNSARISSFHLEMLVKDSLYSISQSESQKVLSSYSLLIVNFFHYACLNINEPIYDEVGERVDLYLDKSKAYGTTLLTRNIKTSREILWSKLKQALNISHLAVYCEQNKKIASSIRNWKFLFKRYFPEP